MQHVKEYTLKAVMRDGLVYVTREIVGLTFPCSKWDLLSDSEKRAYENTTLTKEGTAVECTGCGEELTTEADFAKHFVIDNLHYLNLGHCPKKK